MVNGINDSESREKDTPVESRISLRSGDLKTVTIFLVSNPGQSLPSILLSSFDRDEKSIQAESSSSPHSTHRESSI